MTINQKNDMPVNEKTALGTENDALPNGTIREKVAG